MASILVVIDRPFRGVLERQFADAVHLARVGVLQFDRVSILLIGQGTLLAAAAPDAAGHAGAELAGTRNLLAAHRAGTPVLVDAQAAQTYGVTAQIPQGFECAESPAIVAAMTTHDHVWYV